MSTNGNAAEDLKVEVDVLANLIGQRTGAVAGVWIDPHKARVIALEIMAAGYRAAKPAKEEA